MITSTEDRARLAANIGDRSRPPKLGKCGTMTHGYKRHGTTTLFAAFNVLDGAVLGRSMQKHTHQEYIRFLNAVESFFSALTRRPIRRGVFKSIVDLQAAINRYLKEHNENSRPLVWTKPAKDFLAKIERLPVSSV